MFKFSAVSEIWKKYIQKLNDWDLPLTTESLDGYLLNLVGIKYSWPPHICIDFCAKSAQWWIQGMAIIGQWGAILQRTSSS